MTQFRVRLHCEQPLTDVAGGDEGLGEQKALIPPDWGSSRKGGAGKTQMVTKTEMRLTHLRAKHGRPHTGS